MPPLPALLEPLEPDLAATAAKRAHAVMAGAARAAQKAEEDAVGRGMAVVAGAVANTIETAVRCYSVTPVGAPVPNADKIMTAIPQANVEQTRQWIIRAAMETGRRAGYNEAQADFVLQMMLTQQGRRMLETLARGVDEGSIEEV